VCVGSKKSGGPLCEHALLVLARPNISIDPYIYIDCCWLSLEVSRGLALVQTGLIILRKKYFIYLFIYLFCSFFLS
jgi:hypothetical protein